MIVHRKGAKDAKKNMSFNWETFALFVFAVRNGFFELFGGYKKLNRIPHPFPSPGGRGVLKPFSIL